MNITVSSNELAELLEVSGDNLKMISKRDQLDERLTAIGYKLVNKEKVGRSLYYTLEPTEADEWLQYQLYRNIRKKDEHTIYVENRLTDEGMKSSRRAFVDSLDINISETTASRYDSMLLEDEVMIKDRTVYLLFNPEKEIFKEITFEEYKQFWKESCECKYQLGHNKMRYNRGLIPESTYETNRYIFLNALGKDKGEVALKFDTYKEYTNTVRVLEMIKQHRSKN